jgi:hypothetical protein
MQKYRDINISTLEGMEPWQGYLSKRKIKLLEKSWAGTFRQHIFPILPVEELAVHYSQTTGRATKDLLTAMGAVILQQIFDLTDEETCEQLAFNQQWHYALATYDPKEQIFAERTLWTVRHHLTQSTSAHKIFNIVTDELANKFNVNTNQQRMDSVHVNSNMANLGRIRLMSRTITSFLKNFKRHFSEQYKQDISEELKNKYMRETSGSYFGSSKPSESHKRLSEIATDMQFLIEKYIENEAVLKMSSYKLMQRVISEQCIINEGICEVKVPKEIPSNSIQNPSDIDAGYDGHKGQGYQVQLSETYSRQDDTIEDEQESELDLITYVKVESADEHDSKALAPAIDEMESRAIKPEEILVDSLYGSDENVIESLEKDVRVISPVMGKKSAKNFDGFEFDSKTKIVLSCPMGKVPNSVKPNKKGTITARWSKEDCQNCPMKETCQAQRGPRGHKLFYSEKDIRLWQRRKFEDSPEFKDKYRYRSGIEATNSRYIHMTGARRVRYRGLKNVEFAETMKALGINMFRVLKHVQKTGKFLESNSILAVKTVILAIIFTLKSIFRNLYKEISCKCCFFGFTAQNAYF